MNEESTNAVVLAEPSASIVSMAAQMPERNLPAIQAAIRDVACSDGELARSCIWVRPVGKKGDRVEFELGPSVRLTELAHQQLKMIWLSPPRIQHTGNTVEVVVMAYDLKAINMAPGTASKNVSGYKDTQIELVKSACVSIAKREAILGLYRAQIQAILSSIKDRIIRDLVQGEDEKASMSKAWKQLVSDYAQIGVKEAEMIEAVESEPDRRNKLVLLIGILRSIREGGLDIKYVFGHEGSKPNLTGDPGKKSDKKAGKSQKSGKGKGEKATGKAPPSPDPEADKAEEATTKGEASAAGESGGLEGAPDEPATPPSSPASPGKDDPKKVKPKATDEEKAFEGFRTDCYSAAMEAGVSMQQLLQEARDFGPNINNLQDVPVDKRQDFVRYIRSLKSK